MPCNLLRKTQSEMLTTGKKLQ